MPFLGKLRRNPSTNGLDIVLATKRTIFIAAYSLLSWAICRATIGVCRILLDMRKLRLSTT